MYFIDIQTEYYSVRVIAMSAYRLSIVSALARDFRVLCRKLRTK